MQRSATAAVNFTTNRTGGTTTYSWTNNTTSIGLLPAVLVTFRRLLLQIQARLRVTATVTVTPSFEGCPELPSHCITVNPSGQVNDPSDQCCATVLPQRQSISPRTGQAAQPHMHGPTATLR
jgi:hypothetical protein